LTKETGVGEVGRRQTDEGFDAFFNAVWPRATGTATRMGLSREEAEDVALDALAITCDRWDRVRRMEYGQAWTLKVTTNLALRRLKKRPDPVPADSAESSLEDGVTNRLALGDEIRRLPRRQREVVALRYLADLPEVDVARALGLDVGTVKQHASRGRHALKQALGRSGQEVGDGV
jgi:RNA polymerase sigma factor (sigma-70 family)